MNFNIHCGTPELAFMIADQLNQHGLCDAAEAAITIVLDHPHRFAFEALAQYRQQNHISTTSLIVVTSSACAEYIEDLWDYNIAALLATGHLHRDLADLVCLVANGGRYRITSVAPTTLTPSEREVLRLLADGLDNKQIAAQTHRTHQVVKNIVSHILQKLCLSKREEAILYYWSLLSAALRDREVGG